MRSFCEGSSSGLLQAERNLTTPQVSRSWFSCSSFKDKDKQVIVKCKLDFGSRFAWPE